MKFFAFSNHQKLEQKVMSALMSEHGLTKQEAETEIKLLNEYMLESIYELYESGLRGDHLRAWKKPSYQSTDYFFPEFDYDPAHRDALIFLIKQQHVDGHEAVKMINGLQPGQACSLVELYQFGLTGDMLRDWTTDEETQFSFSHQYSLSYLIKQTEKPIPPAEAIKLIDKKNGHEAIELLFSELFEKFKHLEACKQTISKVLPSLLHIGVTADHFALWNLDGIQFTEEHAELISKMKYFMKRTPEEAIRYICDERVTPEQAKELIITASRSRNADLDSALQSPHHQATDRQIEMLYNDLGRVKSFRI